MIGDYGEFAAPVRQRPTEADCRRLDRPDLDPKSAQWPRLERPLSRNPPASPCPGGFSLLLGARRALGCVVRAADPDRRRAKMTHRRGYRVISALTPTGRRIRSKKAGRIRVEPLGNMPPLCDQHIADLVSVNRLSAHGELEITDLKSKCNTHVRQI
jgi:hypothetical protein